MTLTLLELVGSHVGVLAIGYLAGRRAIRRKLQTTQGRQDLGGRLVTQEQPVTELPTTQLRRLTVVGEPTEPTYAIPMPR